METMYVILGAALIYGAMGLGFGLFLKPFVKDVPYSYFWFVIAGLACDSLSRPTGTLKLV